MIRTEPIDAPLGALATGWDPGAPLTDEDLAALRQGLADRLVVVLRGQRECDADDLAALARQLGEPFPADELYNIPTEVPEVLAVSNELNDDGHEVGTSGSGPLPWHTDYAFDRRPAMAQAVQGDGSTASSLGVFTWADHTIADEMFIVPLPDDSPTDVTAIIGCAVMTGAGAVMNTAGVTAGSSVAIFGVGGVGLSALAAAKALGADPIIAVDLSEEKLDFARSHGATIGVNASECDPVARIHELTPRDGLDLMGAPCSGVDFAFDCIGAAVGQVVPSLRNKRWGSDERAVAVLVGIPTAALDVDISDLLMHEKHLTGSIGGTCHPEQDFPIFMDWYRQGVLDLDSLVTQRFALDEINEAVDALENGQIAGRSILVFD